MNTDNFPDRLKGLLEERGISQRELARRLGLSNVSVNQWVKGVAKPSRDTVPELCSVLGVTPSYLLYGDAMDPAAQLSIRDADTVSIPLLDVRAACGNGFFNVAASLIRFVQVSVEFLRRYCASANLSALHIITAAGDSMEPTLSDGDAVIIDSSDQRITRDGLYAVRLGESILVKRIQILPDGFSMISDNPRYPPVHVKAFEDASIIGRAYAGLCIKRL